MSTDNPRTRAADRMLGEMHAYIADAFPQALGAWDHAWDMVERPAVRLMEEVARYEQGEVTFSDLEAAGTRYVEAWEAAHAAWQRRAAA